jgi:hypothetical protein
MQAFKTRGSHNQSDPPSLIAPSSVLPIAFSPDLIRQGDDALKLRGQRLLPVDRSRGVGKRLPVNIRYGLDAGLLRNLCAGDPGRRALLRFQADKPDSDFSTTKIYAASVYLI